MQGFLISDIECYVADTHSAKEIEDNPLLFDALCRRFAIVGEALYQANKMTPQLNITDINKITGLRHIIVHDYATVRAADLWMIITRKLSILKAEIELLLKSFE